MIKQNCTTYFFSLQNLIIKIEYAWPTTSLFPIIIPLSFKQRIMEQRSCSWWFSLDHLSLFTLSSLFSFIFDLQTQPFCSILNSFFLQYTKCQMSKLVPHKMYKMSSREHNIKVLKNVSVTTISFSMSKFSDSCDRNCSHNCQQYPRSRWNCDRDCNLKPWTQHMLNWYTQWIWTYQWIFCNGELLHKLSFQNHRTCASHQQNKLH